jgi:hypothetical protein
LDKRLNLGSKYSSQKGKCESKFSGCGDGLLNAQKDSGINNYNADSYLRLPGFWRTFSKKGAVIVTHDQDFKRVKHLKGLLTEHRVGYIIFRVPKGVYQYWDIVKAFINKWEQLKEKISRPSIRLH